LRGWPCSSLPQFTLGVGLALLLGGCFWTSSAPDLETDDAVAEVVVLWNLPRTGGQLERASWSTRDRSALGALTSHLQMETWTSSSVLPAAHDTRIILTLRSERVWEIVLSPGDPASFRWFDRQSHGRSGSIAWSSSFLAELTQLMEADFGKPIDLETEHRSELRLGTRSQSVPASTQAYLDRFPGYPEMRWNAALEKFEHTE